MLVSWRRSGSMATVMPCALASGAMRRPKSTSCLNASSFGEAVRHPARAAAAEDDDLRAEPREPRERLPDVRHLLLAIDLRAGHLQRARAGTGSSPAPAVPTCLGSAPPPARSRRPRAPAISVVPSST